jgi:hypothetical protein
LVAANAQTPSSAIFLSTGEQATWEERYKKRRHEVEGGPPTMEVELKTPKYRRRE